MEVLEHFIWTYLTIPLLLIVSAFLTIYASAPQFRLKKMTESLQKKDIKSGLSPVATLMIALSARVGVGTLAGTGLAIYIGGPGTIFWMWVSAIVTAASTFAENTLAQNFKRSSNGKHYGGPAFYIKDALKKPKLAAMYAILLVITYTLGFVAVQMNTMTTVFKEVTEANVWLIASMLAVMTAITISGGITKISKLVARIMPVIAIFFFGLATTMLLLNFSYLPTFFIEIITNAFEFTSLAGGGIGVAMITGIKRGVFSNEAGLGTGAHAAALSHHQNPQEQGYIGILGIYLTTILSVTLVAFMIMSTDAHNQIVHAGNGIEFLHFSLQQHFGHGTTIILPTIIFFFGFSTVITAYLYGEMNIKFLTHKKSAVTWLKLTLLFVVFVASTSNPKAIWHLVDIGVGLTALINLIAIFLLRRYVKCHQR